MSKKEIYTFKIPVENNCYRLKILVKYYFTNGGKCGGKRYLDFGGKGLQSLVYATLMNQTRVFKFLFYSETLVPV